MSSLLKKLMDIELWSGSVEAFSNTFEYAEELQSREELPKLLKSISGSISKYSTAETFLEVSSLFLPYAKLAGIVLSHIQKRNDAKDYPECIAIAFFIAYLESLTDFSKGISFEKSQTKKYLKIFAN